MPKCYALYKGDHFIDLGSKQYLAEKIGVKVGTIEFYMTPSYKKRWKNEYSERYLVIRVED